jgi:hypothetical protein
MDINKDTKPMIILPGPYNATIRTPYQVILSVTISLN